MKRTLILLLSFYLIQGSLFSQRKYSQIKIDLSNTTLAELAALGLEVDHGEIYPGKHIVNVFSDDEMKLLEEHSFEYKVIVDDVKALYKDYGTMDVNEINASFRGSDCNQANSVAEDMFSKYETPQNYAYGSMGGYVTYAEAIAQLDLMHELYPELITERAAVGDIVTHDGNQIYHFRISDNATEDEDEPEVLYTAITHAREPNGLSAVLFYMWYLLENYGTNPEVTYLVDNSELYFIPIINPDGYLFNEFTDPSGGGLWRKNTYRNEEGELVGVDLNRNFGYFWGYNDIGSSNDEFSQTYRGIGAFSEPETQAVRDFCNSREIKIALNYHTSGNLLIHPWGYEDGPTEEDATFKMLGNFMVDENDFKLGTALETVQYNVNGVSDDWMYGDTKFKDKIYAFTPEVGPSFWPSQTIIDFLNKTTVRHNLNTALLLHSWGRLEEQLALDELMLSEGFLYFKFTKIGLQEGPVSFAIESNSPGMVIEDNGFISDAMMSGDEMDVTLAYTIDPEQLESDSLEIKLIVDNGAFIQEQIITKTYKQVVGNLNVNVLSDLSNLEAFNTDSWGLTTEDYFSAPSCVTDSPNMLYDNQANNEILLAEPVDLSLYTDANLKFNARWAIEDNWDYVQLLVSTDGFDYTPLCGKYTNAANEFQLPDGSPLYDGYQNDWVLESVCLNDYLGEETVFIKFHFVSDGAVNDDGFYFDDLIVEGIIDESLSTFELDNKIIYLRPNPANNQITLSMDPSQFVSGLEFQVFDLLGSKITNGLVKRPSQEINITNLNPGVYVLKIMENGKQISGSKFIKQ